MAIGLGKILGFNFPENFKHPYSALSLQDFWRRWHISLSTWFRDYLYIPLGGNQKGPVRTYINQITVFFLCGLWHGASWNFVVWGLYHGIIMSIEKFFGLQDQVFRFKFLSRIYTIFIALIGWVYFRALDMDHANAFIGRMFSFSRADFVNASLIPREFFIIFVLALLFASARPYLEFVKFNLRLRVIILGVLFSISVALLSAQSFSPFIYFRF